MQKQIWLEKNKQDKGEYYMTKESGKNVNCFKER